MGKLDAVTIKINNDYCGRCLICPPLCPYEAISVDPETEEVNIDVEKCQFCGICYSACPVNAVEIVYYNYDELLKKLEESTADKKSETLVLMCRGNSPPTCEVEGILGSDVEVNSIPLRIPCVGRVPTEFILRLLGLGFKKIVAIRCEDDFCRYKQGSRINNRRLLLTKRVVNELGFNDEVLRIVPYSRKVVYDTSKCVGCDKCVFICPYEAIEAESLATPRIDTDKCVGCGACAMVCPHIAIQVEGFEYETTSNRIHLLGTAARRLRSKGVSPIVLVFCCQWSEFSSLDRPEIHLFDNKAVLMEIPCFKGLDPYHVIEALNAGFDGVLAVVCSETDCKLERGYDVAERNTTVLRRALREMNLLERFELYTASPRMTDDFKRHLGKFIEKCARAPGAATGALQANEEGV